MSVGVGTFPFGLFTTSFNVGGGGGGDDVNGNNAAAEEAETMSKLFMAIAVFFIVWLFLVNICGLGLLPRPSPTRAASVTTPRFAGLTLHTCLAPGDYAFFLSLSLSLTRTHSLCSCMVRVKYRYIVTSVAVGVNSGAAPRAGGQSGYPGFHLYSNDDARGKDSATSTETLLFWAIKKSVKQMHGSFGMGRVMSRFRIIYWNPLSGLLIVRALRGLATLQLISAMTMLTEVKVGDANRPALIDVLRLCGSVRSCQKFLVQFYRQQISGFVSGVQETAIAKAVTRKLIDSNAPNLNLELN
ncbi:unnamed protein product [Schistocephalus solidus]|uniref:Ribonuclease P n=1 Tax=Schistocephalus solidus TaxID=70667 RepID=A0A183T5N9_SCHSO|nr:unnamed protein product [Schistocephalus solidus]